MEVDMPITRYRPLLPDLGWSRLGEMPGRFGRVFEDLLTPWHTGEEMGWSPAVDVTEKEDELLVTAELPGMRHEDLEVEVSDGVLTIKGEKREEREEKGARRRVWERSYGAFERTFSLPRSVDADKVAAEFEQGVLTVHLPKTKQAQGRRVQVGGKK
jgi:HSP20 family protein